MSTSKYPFIVKDSKENIYRFSMSEDNHLMLESFCENTITTKIILRENISNFVVDIDDKDIIHVIYVDKNNKLYYSMYSTELIDSNFFNIKDENIDYRFLFFKFIIDRLYLFFITRSANNLQCTLNSCTIKDNNITVVSILTISCSKYTCPYFIYSNSDCIYILHSKNSNEKYSIQTLDTYKNKWYEHLNTITLEKASHINFIVNDGIALICYNSFQNNNILLKLVSINLKSSSLINEQISLPNINFTALHSLIIPFENFAAILCCENERLAYYNFIYDKFIIEKKQYVSVEKSELHYANYRSNFCESLKLSTLIPYTLSDNLLFIITDFQNTIPCQIKKTSKHVPAEVNKRVSILEKEVSILEKESPLIEEASPDTEYITFTPINVDFLEITPYLNDYIKELYSSAANTNDLLSTHIENNKNLTNQVDYLTRLNSSYKSRIEDLKSRLIEYRNDSATVLIKYKNVISHMEFDKSKLISLIEEKNALITSLKRIIHSHEK